MLMIRFHSITKIFKIAFIHQCLPSSFCFFSTPQAAKRSVPLFAGTWKNCSQVGKNILNIFKMKYLHSWQRGLLTEINQHISDFCAHWVQMECLSWGKLLVNITESLDLNEDIWWLSLYWEGKVWELAFSIKLWAVSPSTVRSLYKQLN